mgnify:CR=1 FL=1
MTQKTNVWEKDLRWATYSLKRNNEIPELQAKIKLLRNRQINELESKLNNLWKY